jgi:hypothetical protein
VLVPQNSKFKVVAYEGITPVRLQLMEETFSYGITANGLAGHAVNRRSPIIINDLSNNEDAELFIKLSKDDTKTGSAIAYPILRGLGSTTAEPIAVLCITSIKKQAFPIELTKQFLSYYSAKIEILQNCIDIAELIKR